MSSHYSALNITKPVHCTIAFGIPTTEREFIIAGEAKNREFAKNILWEQYYDEVVHVYNNVKHQYEKLGVHIFEGLTFSYFHTLFCRADVNVIVLFSHWKEKINNTDITEGAVEFFDGFSTSSRIIEQIPINYTGILDLCVCHPNHLVNGIIKQRPDCLVRYAKTEATPLFWLYFYLDIFNRLQAQELTYSDAFRESVHAFLAT